MHQSRVLYNSSQFNPATGDKLSPDMQPFGFTDLNDVVGNAVHQLLIEGLGIPIGVEIVLQGFRFNTFLLGNVLNMDGGKIWLSRNWAQGRKVLTVKFDEVVPLGVVVVPGIQVRRIGGFGKVTGLTQHFEVLRTHKLISLGP